MGPTVSFVTLYRCKVRNSAENFSCTDGSRWTAFIDPGCLFLSFGTKNKACQSCLGLALLGSLLAAPANEIASALAKRNVTD